MKIVIANIVALNGGDAAIMEGMISAYKYVFGDDVEIFLFDKNPEISATLYPQYNWYETLGLRADRTRFNRIRYIGKVARKIRRLKFLMAARFYGLGFAPAKYLLDKYSRGCMKIYKEADVVVSTGGTYLVGSYGVLTQYLDYKITHRLGRKLVLYTMSIGPFGTVESKNMMRKALSWPQIILVRDNRSVENVKKLNCIPAPCVKIMPDAAFGLGDVVNIRESGTNKIGEKKNVAFSVRKWHDFGKKSISEAMHSYISSMAKLAEHLIELGYKVHYFSTCQGVRQYDNDNEVVDEIVNLLPKNIKGEVVRYEEYLSNGKIMSLLRQMDFIVATRLHMSILALISGTPVYPIAYEFKNEELFYFLGYHYVEKMGDIKPTDLVNRVDEFLQVYDSTYRAHVNDKVISLVNDSIKGAKILKEVVDL